MGIEKHWGLISSFLLGVSLTWFGNVIAGIPGWFVGLILGIALVTIKHEIMEEIRLLKVRKR